MSQTEWHKPKQIVNAQLILCKLFPHQQPGADSKLVRCVQVSVWGEVLGVLYWGLILMRFSALCHAHLITNTTMHLTA